MHSFLRSPRRRLGWLWIPTQVHVMCARCHSDLEVLPPRMRGHQRHRAGLEAMAPPRWRYRPGSHPV